MFLFHINCLTLNGPKLHHLPAGNEVLKSLPFKNQIIQELVALPNDPEAKRLLGFYIIIGTGRNSEAILRRGVQTLSSCFDDLNAQFYLFYYKLTGGNLFTLEEKITALRMIKIQFQASGNEWTEEVVEKFFAPFDFFIHQGTDKEFESFKKALAFLNQLALYLTLRSEEFTLYPSHVVSCWQTCRC